MLLAPAPIPPPLVVALVIELGSFSAGGIGANSKLFSICARTYPGCRSGPVGPRSGFVLGVANRPAQEDSASICAACSRAAFSLFCIVASETAGGSSGSSPTRPPPTDTLASRAGWTVFAPRWRTHNDAGPSLILKAIAAVSYQAPRVVPSSAEIRRRDLVDRAVEPRRSCPGNDVSSLARRLRRPPQRLPDVETDAEPVRKPASSDQHRRAHGHEKPPHPGTRFSGHTAAYSIYTSAAVD